jgi:arylsulfatase
MELVGAAEAIPTDIDGISMADELLGKPQPPREFLYREFAGYGGQQSIRVGDWKAIRRGLKPRPRDPQQPVMTELFDLAKDPAETTDLADQHPDLVASLEVLMKSCRTPSTDFPIPALDNAAD